MQHGESVTRMFEEVGLQFVLLIIVVRMYRIDSLTVIIMMEDEREESQRIYQIRIPYTEIHYGLKPGRVGCAWERL